MLTHPKKTACQEIKYAGVPALPLISPYLITEGKNQVRKPLPDRHSSNNSFVELIFCRIVITLIIFSTGCATTSEKWSPTINMDRELNVYSIDRDLHDCKILAKQAVKDQNANPLKIVETERKRSEDF
ncbi:hypothetical protein [Methylomonas sp. AM2-LC]|uniref:hypothetical protein n=1 Tax=Methylomonas sp. AM2-LC TaxID=3153301 RepID=UPI0032642BD2